GALFVGNMPETSGLLLLNSTFVSTDNSSLVAIFVLEGGLDVAFTTFSSAQEVLTFGAAGISGRVTNSIMVSGGSEDAIVGASGQVTVSWSLFSGPIPAIVDDLGDNLSSRDPLLQPLADNGGATRT